jgi:hypothetical protein
MRTPRASWRTGSLSRSVRKADCGFLRNRKHCRCVKLGMATTSVDPQALRLAAQRLDTAADLLDAAIDRLGQAGGGAVEQIVADIAQWQRGARDGAAGLRTVAARHIEQDNAGAEALR